MGNFRKNYKDPTIIPPIPPPPSSIPEFDVGTPPPDGKDVKIVSLDGSVTFTTRHITARAFTHIKTKLPEASASNLRSQTNVKSKNDDDNHASKQNESEEDDEDNEDEEEEQESDEDDQQTSAFPSQTSILLQRIRNETFRQLELAWKAQQELARLVMIPEPDSQSQIIWDTNVHV